MKENIRDEHDCDSLKQLWFWDITYHDCGTIIIIESNNRN